MLRKKEQSNKSPSSVGLIRGELVTNQHEHLTEELEIDDDFKPFISQVFFLSDWQWTGCLPDYYFERYWCEEFFGSVWYLSRTGHTVVQTSWFGELDCMIYVSRCTPTFHPLGVWHSASWCARSFCLLQKFISYSGMIWLAIKCFLILRR